MGPHSWSALRSAWEDFDVAASDDEAALLAMCDSNFPRPWHKHNSITLVLRAEKRALKAVLRIMPLPADDIAPISRALGGWR